MNEQYCENKEYSKEEIEKLKYYSSIGKTDKEISSLLGRTLNSVKSKRKQLKIPKNSKFGNNKNHEEYFVDRFNEMFGNKFEYISGYENCESKITIKCKRCGAMITKSAQSIRHKNVLMFCETCDINIPKMIRQQKNILRKEKDKETRQISKEIKTIGSWLKRNTVYIKTCECCGKTFYSSKNKKYCTNDCNKKIINKNKDVGRRIKIKNATVDKGIYISKLYQRDNGKCYLCGVDCDFNDYQITNEGHFITGNNYPTIEHIIPLSKGGKHSWDNVKLSCFRCNTLKGNKIIPRVKK